MLLGGKALKQAFQRGTWKAFRGNDPIYANDLEGAIGPNSIDVTLHPKILRLRPALSNDGLPEDHQKAMGALHVGHKYVDVHDPNSIETYQIKPVDADGACLLIPGEFYIGSVQERFDCSSTIDISQGRPGYGGASRAAHFVQHYDGRSTCGRLGIQSHMTAGFGDYGFAGSFTLEIQVAVPIKVYAGMRIGQVFFTETYAPEKYQGAYGGDNHFDGPVAPVLGPDRF